MKVMVLLKWASGEQELNQKSIIHRMPLRAVTVLVWITQVFVLQMNFIIVQNVIWQADFQLIEVSESIVISSVQENGQTVP